MASIRPYYMAAVLEALRALKGSATPSDVYDWLRKTRRARAEDVEATLESGGSRFEKEVRFAALALVRAGLVSRERYGIWELSPPGWATTLDEAAADELHKAVRGLSSGPLNADGVYRAILQAARARRFISYGELAAAGGMEWVRARRPLPLLLGRLVQIAAVRGWPILSAIVVSKPDLETGRLEGESLNGFLAAARDVGVDPGPDVQAFVRDQQQQIFTWALTAPETLGIGERDEAEEEDADAVDGIAEPRVQPSPQSAAVDREIRYWFGGAAWQEGDQTERFIREGIWQNGYEDRFSGRVRQIAPGDRIAIKSSFVRKKNLPFDVGGKKVSAMRIKATGVVTANRGDGLTVEVRWDPSEPARDWYFYTYRETLHEADPEVEQALRLIQFAFLHETQDFNWWLAQPYFAAKYKRTPILAPQAETGTEDADEEVEAAVTPPSYTVESIIADGCFLPPETLRAMIDRLEAKKNLILQGPPGTGKTWLAKRLGYALLGSRDREESRARMRVVQFHPSSTYEDFVRGWRPTANGFALQDGVFMQAIEAAKAEDTPFVLVIEEINRGNPAQIFGEMLTAMEDSKRNRDEALELIYPKERGERVYLPDNLFVVGTMNVADRSLALVDLALRRRFAFWSLEPAFGPRWREWCRDVGGLGGDLVDLIERQMVELNETIAQDRSLGPQFRIGHSFFTPTRAVDGDGERWRRAVVETEIMPLLEEYWYDQPSQVAEARAALLSR